MYPENLIPINEFCTIHNIETSFITSIRKTGLIEITIIEKEEYIHTSQLQELEKIVHLYYELDINLEGIETISHLLRRINDLQNEITALNNRLRLYESNE
jgi:hypothetical protein